ncbi:restriction endonuclease [Microbulbifer sp. PAAF003]|uniref:restriction endonuclease n=1 Tax=Microbulbifer sp. PAAF003 TaxID=3243375 RepID=UPI00403A6FC5
MSKRRIDLAQLSDKEFEELCFEIILTYNFEKVTWRKGGADNGRDIEAVLESNFGLVDKYYETWFFECKRYSNGVPPEPLNSKIAWADAENPDHLVFLISSHLTNNARTWIDKIAHVKPYKIHILEGDQITRAVLSNPQVAEKLDGT